MTERRRYAAATAVMIAAFTGLRLLYALPLNALPDEADNFVWSQHLDYGYFDQPPLLMWLLALAYRALGNGTLAIRLVPALLGAWSSYYVFRLGRETAGDRVAFWSVAIMNLTLLFTFGAMLATPDTPMVLFLSGASYYAYRGLTGGQTRAWVLAGLFAGLALLSKYTAVLFFASCALCLLLPEHRKWLTRRQPWLALLIALLVFSPQIAWNHAHEWVSFGFQWSHGLGTGKFPQWPRVPEYFGLQAAVVGPILFGLLIAVLVMVARSWRREPAGRRFLWCLSVVPIGFFLCSSLFHKVEANWPCFAYVPGILLVTDLYEDRLKQARLWRALWRLSWVWSAIALSVVLLHIYVPFLPVRKDRGAEFFGWDALGAEATSLSREYPGLGLAANRYQLASELALYSGLPVTCLNIGGRANQYDLWQDFDSLRGRPYLFFHESRAEESRVFGSFTSFRHVRTLVIRGRGDRVLRQVFVYAITLPR
jgi:4-amino-4-deoxy-L-arabinose transferase-like glycosyltransferase